MDEELDILRRSRSEITGSLSSSSSRELEGGREGVGVGKTGLVLGMTGRGYCKTPGELAENLRFLQRRCETRHDWDWRFATKGRCVERESDNRPTDFSLQPVCEGADRFLVAAGGTARWFPFETVIGVWEGKLV